jgi:transcriptional regulator with XRE-family HTH domain
MSTRMMIFVRTRRVDSKILVHFSSRLRQLRAAHNISQKELAQKLHMGLKTLMFYEQAKMAPSIEAAAKLARFFGVSVDSLIYPDPAMDQLKDRELLEYLLKADELTHQDKSLIKEMIDALLTRQQLRQGKADLAA